MWTAFSPDGRLAATGSFDNTAKIWNLANGSLVRTLVAHTAGVNAVNFSPDGARLATASQDGTAKIWDVNTGNLLLTLSGHTNGVTHVAFSRDGSRIVTTSRDFTIKIWNATTGAVIRTLVGHKDVVDAAIFNADGTQILSAGRDSTIRFWNAETGALQRVINGFGSWVWYASYSHNGKWIATAGRDGIVKIFDAATGEQLFTWLAHNGDVGSVMFSPDDAYLLTGANDNKGRIWTMPMVDVSDNVWSIATPVLRLIQPNGGEVMVPGAQAYIRWEGTDPSQAVTLDYSIDGGETWSIMVAGVTGSQYLWNVPNTPSTRCLARISAGLSNSTLGAPIILSGHDDWVNSVSYSADCSLASTSSDDNTAKIWNAQTGQLIHTLSGHSGDVMWTAFSPNGNLAATASYDATAKIWNLTNGTVLRTLAGHSAGLNSVAFSPDGTRVATASEDGTARVWDVATGACLMILAGHTNGLYGVAYSPDGTKILTTSRDFTIRMWDAANGTLIRAFVGHSDVVHSAIFSADGMHILSAGRDRTVRVWDANTGIPEQTLTGFGDWVWYASYSHNGQWIATAGRDGGVKLFDAATGTQLLSFIAHAGDVGSVMFDANDTHLLTGANDKLGKIWTIPSLQPPVSDVSDNFWEIRQVTTGVGQEESGSADETETVIYPNPADQSATITYSTETPGHVRMQLFDLRGTEVRSIVDDVLPAGRHTSVIPVQDLAPGTYFVAVESSGHRSIRTLQLVR
jgi:WD40 repeat protein